MIAHAGAEAATTCHSWEVFLTPHITHPERPTDVQARQRYSHSYGLILAARVERVEKECGDTTLAQRLGPYLHCCVAADGMQHLRTGVPVPYLIHLYRLFVGDDIPNQVVSLAVAEAAAKTTPCQLRREKTAVNLARVREDWAGTASQISQGGGRDLLERKYEGGGNYAPCAKLTSSV